MTDSSVGQSDATDWREAGRPFFDRIGAACDRIAAHYPEIADAIAGHTRERRGVIGKLAWPGEQARHIMHLADEAERWADFLDAEAEEIERTVSSTPTPPHWRFGDD